VGQWHLDRWPTAIRVSYWVSGRMTEHLGYEAHDPAGIGADNIRNGPEGSRNSISGLTRRDQPGDGVWSDDDGGDVALSTVAVYKRGIEGRVHER